MVKIIKGKKAAFLDRDGVINRSLVKNGKPFAPLDTSEFEIMHEAKETIWKLKEANFLVVVVTNQPDLSTGRLNAKTLKKMHEYLTNECEIDLIKICPHLDKDNCNCRKPKPGLLFDAAKEMNINLKKSFIVGDRWRDISAGQQAGCGECFFIDYNYNEKKPSGNFISLDSFKEVIYKLDNLN